MAYSIESYGRMISSASRMAAFEGALRAACRPGSVVLDLGAGTGMMSLYACRAGAGRVYAVEASDAIVVARDFAADNGMADRITFIQARSTDITLPERVDVIVADLRGVLPMFQSSLASMIDARRFLAPGGVIIPSKDSVRGALVEAAEIFDSFVAPWRSHSGGFDASAAERRVLQSWRKHLLTVDVLLTAPQDMIDIDYQTLETPNVRATIRVPVARPRHGARRRRLVRCPSVRRVHPHQRAGHDGHPLWPGVFPAAGAGGRRGRRRVRDDAPRRLDARLLPLVLGHADLFGRGGGERRRAPIDLPDVAAVRGAPPAAHRGRAPVAWSRRRHRRPDPRPARWEHDAGGHRRIAAATLPRAVRRRRRRPRSRADRRGALSVGNG